MESDEETNNHWREIRARVDSLSNAVFLISGGALTLSVNVLLGLKKPLDSRIHCFISFAWSALLAAIFLFILLKGLLIWQSYRRLTVKEPNKISNILSSSNKLGWFLGVVGAISFFVGMCLMVYSAMLIIKP